MQNNKHLIYNPPQITPEILAADLQRLIFTCGQIFNILKDVIFDIESNADFETMYGADFKKINNYVKENPGKPLQPENFPDIPARTIKLYAVISMINPLLPPPPGSVQIVKPN